MHGEQPASIEPNPPVYVYDTSGPYTDPDARIDIRSGLPALRAGWIAERGDTEALAGPTSRYGQARLADPKLAELRFDLHRLPKRAKPGCNVSQMHYARRGIVTPEMEYVAIRENLEREAYVASLMNAGPTGGKMAELLDAASIDIPYAMRDVMQIGRPDAAIGGLGGLMNVHCSLL